MELVERAGALQILDELLAEALGGSGRVALVSGEAGVGKTALVRRFLAGCEGDVRVLEGACDPVGTPRPLGPVVDIAATVGGDLARLIERGSGAAPVFEACGRSERAASRAAPSAPREPTRTTSPAASRRSSPCWTKG
jgi:predicted ATPase